MPARLQFSLLKLFWVMTMMAIWCGAWGYLAHLFRLPYAGPLSDLSWMYRGTPRTILTAICGMTVFAGPLAALCSLFDRKKIGWNFFLLFYLIMLLNIVILFVLVFVNTNR